uniref:TetR family transcriptional regulator n=1 Tax=Streptomyces sp. NBC_00003 TaxID=2903608 RepID=A0AAU2V6R9_9ACTN
MTKQERAARTRHALVRAAAETFERCGYVQAKLADISAGAGVSQGALHFHFESKAALAATVESSAGVSLRREAWVSQRAGMNALQRLTNTTHALASKLRLDVVARAGYKLSLEAPHGPGPTLPQEWQICVRQLMEESAQEGLLVKGADPAEVADTVVAATTGFELLGRESPDSFSDTALTAFWRLILPCVAHPAALAVLEPGGAQVRTLKAPVA